MAAGGIRLTSYAGFTLVGWIGLFVPSLLLVLQDEFERTDAEFAPAYFVIALGFASGALSSGLVSHRLGRQVTLPVSAMVIAGGMALEGLAPSWAVFVAGAALAALGSGALDAVLSSVIMDLSPPGSGQGLSLLHLFYGVGALAAPMIIGVLLALGVDWRSIALATGLAGLALAAPLARAGRVPSRPPGPVAASTDRGGRASSPSRLGPRLALATLGIAIACYVASESGISSWLVGFLSSEPSTLATFALGLFWTGLAGGRLVASRIADRFDSVRFTVVCAFAGGAAIVVALIVPVAAARVACFTLAGLAFGPVYPMILAVAGSLFPHRAAAVAGIVTASGVAGAIAYPPMMGIAAGAAGLGAGMLGAALLILAAGVAVVVAGRVAGGRDQARPERGPDVAAAHEVAPPGVDAPLTPTG